MTTHAPRTEQEAAAFIAAAAARRTPLALEGGGSKRGIGRPVQSETTVSTAKLTGITLYEPAELAIGAGAGTPLGEIASVLAEKGQRLPFEPMDHRALMGSAGEPTIGGIVAGNISGPRRIQAGACRDLLMGVRLVNGRGESVKSGGRVMKNVTGLDLCKLVAGAWGTLGFITEVIFKVLPAPETEATLVLAGLDDVRAIAALAAGLGSPFEVTGAAHLPAGLDDPFARTALRLEGFANAVAYRSERLAGMLAPFGAVARLEREPSQALWSWIRDVGFFAAPSDRAVWRISAAPSKGPQVTAAMARSIACTWFYDWGGGLIWLACDPARDAGASVIHSAAAAANGHAALIRAPDGVRAAVDVFRPPGVALMRLTRGIKASFDPAGIFNPGRMYAGI